MAERRMFAKTIIDSDAFLDMPLSSQALYFHLSMRADDDGFINNPRKIQRMIGASDDDLKLLIVKRFILPFDSVVVIKHWKIHNYIQKDRYKPTIYQEEKALIAVKGNKAYTDNLNNVYITDTQVRLGKDSLELGKDSKGKNKGKEKTADKKDCQHIADLFNTLCPSLPPVIILSDSIIQDLTESLNKYANDIFKQVFEKAEKSPFLKGKNERKWTASFDWLIKEENIAKVLNGNFDDTGKQGSPELTAIENWINKGCPKTIADDDSIRERAEALKQKIAGNC